MSFHPRESHLVVLEPGSYTTKVGIADYQNASGTSKPTLFKSLGKSIAPIKSGIVVDWESLVGLWTEILSSQFKIDFAKNNHALLVTIPPSWSRDDVERLTQTVFETWNFPGFQILDQPIAALYGHGDISGAVVDLGHETTDVSLVFDNALIRRTCKTSLIGGKDVDEYLVRLLETDPSFVEKSLLSPEFIKALKHSNVLKPSKTRTQVTSFKYQNREIRIGPIADKAFDVLFNPSLIGKQATSVSELIYSTISKCGDLDKRSMFWDHLVLSGGLASHEGMKERIELELKLYYLALSDTCSEFQPREVKWSRLPEHYSAYKGRDQDAGFLGASIAAKVLASSLGFLTKQDYNYFGPSVLYHKNV